MIDLRSDTLTMPDQPMLEMILHAELGDDGRTDKRGRGEDKTINQLEDLAAELTGKEAAVLLPTGTLGNTTAIMTYCQAGDPVLVHKEQHILITEKFVFEPDFGRLKPVCYNMDKRHMPDVAQIDSLLAESGAKLLCLENTHNFSGGYCIDLDTMRRIREVADKRGAKIHMDGARLFHATASLGVSAKEICQYMDSVMFCISKGLGAPVGSLLCSTEAFILKARDRRKLFGGVMRQGGVIAAPGIYALTHNVERMTEDIKNARLTHSLLKGRLKKIGLQEEVQSNILMLEMKGSGITPDKFCTCAAERGLLIRPVLSTSVRLVFYKGITEKEARKAAEIIYEIDQAL
jgi:threonine aldolase